MEGRSFGVSDRGNQGADRLTALAESGDAAAFRDATMFLAVTGIVVGLALLALGIALRSRLSPKINRLLAPCAYGALGVVPASFIVGQVGAVRASLLPTAVLVLLVAAVFAALATAVDRRWPGTGALVAVGSIVALIALDILAGAPLQLNTTFGYSVAVAGRFTGLGNLAFALFGAATIVLAALIVDRWGRRGLVPAVILLAGVVVVEGLPMMGADVGGVLAMVPAFGVTALVLAGRRVGWRQVAALVGATVVVLLLFALVDAARPAEVQTHLARLGEHVIGARWDTLGKSLSRRWQASLGGAELAAWITVGVVMAGALAYAALAAMGRAGPGATRAITHQPTLAAAAGLAVLGTVGLVANDSSVAVPFTMLIVIAPVVMLRVLRA